MQIQVPPTIDQQTKVFNCKACDIPLALESSRIARHHRYQGRDGPACLFKDTTNTQTSAPFDMQMTTGPHTVCNVSCAGCEKLVGWTYINAPTPQEQYKVGSVMLEKELLVEGILGQSRPESHL